MTIAIDRLGFIADHLLSLKGPCRAATTSSIVLSNNQTIDGVILADNDRVLVKNQSNAIDNGLYLVKASEWDRTPDFDQAGQVVRGTRVLVTDGATQGLTEWYVSTSGRPVPGREAISFADLSAIFDEEAAQDAVGTILSDVGDIDFTYIDTPAAITAAVKSDVVTFAKMQNIATQRVIGRNTALTGDPEEVTLTQLLDWIGAAAHGDVLYRGAVSWARLGAGTNGQFLQTKGAGANPQWATPSGGLVSRAYAETADNTSLSATIPFDDTIPQNTEGTEVLTVQITPASTTNRVRLRFQAFAAASTVGNRMGVALFQDSTADALAASASASVNTVAGAKLTLEFEHVPATVSPITYKIRVGPSASDGGSLRLNGTSAARLFGGVALATLIAEELTP